MGLEEVNRIKKIFSELQLHPTYREHAAVITSEEAARTRGDQLKEGIKALLFTNGKTQWVIVDVPADKKVDQKKVAEQVGWSKGKIRMATPEEVLKVQETPKRFLTLHFGTPEKSLLFCA